MNTTEGCRHITTSGDATTEDLWGQCSLQQLELILVIFSNLYDSKKTSRNKARPGHIYAAHPPAAPSSGSDGCPQGCGHPVLPRFSCHPPLGRGSRKEHEGHVHCVSHWPDAHRHHSSQHEGKALQQVALSLGGI